MENIEKFKLEVERKYKELQIYSKLYNSKASLQRESLMNEHKEAFKKNPDSVDISAIAKNMFYLNGFYQADIRKLQNQLLDIYTILKVVYPEITFSKDVEDVINILKTNLPKQLFVTEDGEFKEIEKGKKDELIKDFEQKQYFKMFDKQIRNILNG